MNLGKKRALAARTFHVGESRIEFVKPRLEEIKEAITKQDIRDLHRDGAIKIKSIKGRKTIVGRKRKRSFGKVKKRVNNRKREYIIITRKLRKYLYEIRNKITEKEKTEIKNLIKNRFFKNKNQLKEYLTGVKK